MDNYINIQFPFQESENGFFLKMNKDDKSAIKSDLMHLLLTQKGQRYYLPDFGTDLYKFIFEPNDSITESSIRNELETQIKKYMPNLSITELEIIRDLDNHTARVIIDYKITDDVFTQNDTITVDF